jgi:hypothetical protein
MEKQAYALVKALKEFITYILHSHVIVIQMGIGGHPPFHLAQNSFLAFLVIYYF